MDAHRNLWGWRCNSATQHLPHVPSALGLILSTAKTKEAYKLGWSLYLKVGSIHNHSSCHYHDSPFKERSFQMTGRSRPHKAG